MYNEGLELCSGNTLTNNETIDFDEDDGLFELESTNSTSTINNIFPSGDNLNHADDVIKNSCEIPASLREVSIVFSKKNICKILKLKDIRYVDVSSNLVKYGKHIPVFNSEEIERIINTYSGIAQNLDNDAIARFISMCKESNINNVISYYLKKANSRSKRNSSTVGVENINCKFNVDKFRELSGGIASDDMSFDKTEDITYLVMDNYVRVFWELYMLFVFYRVCEISQDNETPFFNTFKHYIRLALIAGMKMFMQLELDCHYGELYEELKGIKPFNPKYLFVEDIPDKQQIHFFIKNSDFLTEAYRKEYNYAVHIPYKYDNPIKKDKHIDIELHIRRGTTINSVMVEAVFSGQNPLGRVYSADTDPKRVINFQNCYDYDFVRPNAIIFLFRTVLNYSVDTKGISYYTEIYKYLKRYEGSRTRNFVPKLLSVILPILFERPNQEKLKEITNKYFKDTDKVHKAEYRELHRVLNKLLKPKKIRVIDRFREELEAYAW